MSCLNLETIILGKNIKTIGDYAFSNCILLKSIEIPNSTFSIGIAAFNSCFSLSYAYLGTNLEMINNNAFEDCLSIEEIIIPNSVKYIGISVFKHCEKLKTAKIGENVNTINDYAFSATGIFEVDIPNSVKSLGYFSFSFCSSLKRVFIGSSVNFIDSETFIDCESLACIRVHPKNLFYSNFNCDDILYNKRIDIILKYPECKKDEIYIFPPNITLVSVSAFRRCINLKILNMNFMLFKIDFGAFKFCSKLEEIKIPNNVQEIEISAFQYCTKLSTLYIGNGIKRIGSDAFSQCKSLKCIYYYGNKEPIIGHNAFGNIITSVIITTKSYEDNQFGDLNVLHKKGFEECPPIPQNPFDISRQKIKIMKNLKTLINHLKD